MTGLAFILIGFAIAVTNIGPAVVFPAQAQVKTSQELVHESGVEARVRTIASRLRCPVCQGETVYDSHSAIAVQMRKLIREKVEKGDSDQQIVAFFRQRFGDFILLEPPASGHHLLIWLSPILVLGVGATALLYWLRRVLKPEREAASDAAASECNR